MSSIIKSFRVINKDNSSENKEEKNKLDSSINVLIEEAEKDSKVIVANAEKKAKDIVEKAKKQSLEIIESGEEKKESMVHSAYEKSKEVFKEAKENGFKLGHEEGYNEGYGKGYDEGKLSSDKLIKEALQIKEEHLKSKEKLLKNLEEDIIELVITIYEKLIHKTIKEDSELIISLVLKGIEDLDLTDKLTIVTSKDDYDIVQMSQDIILAKSNMISELEIKYDSSLQKGDCILETSKGSIDASLKNQLSEVKELLTSILNNE